jgi:hypothetical protein
LFMGKQILKSIYEVSEVSSVFLVL